MRTYQQFLQESQRIIIVAGVRAPEVGAIYLFEVAFCLIHVEKLLQHGECGLVGEPAIDDRGRLILKRQAIREDPANHQGHQGLPSGLHVLLKLVNELGDIQLQS